jgi:hypothetical protein
MRRTPRKPIERQVTASRNRGQVILDQLAGY